jgi:PAS domain S-box-containing protein
MCKLLYSYYTNLELYLPYYNKTHKGICIKSSNFLNVSLHFFPISVEYMSSKLHFPLAATYSESLSLSMHKFLQNSGTAFIIFNSEMAILGTKGSVNKYIHKTPEGTSTYLLDVIPQIFRKELKMLVQNTIADKKLNTTKARKVIASNGNTYYLRIMSAPYISVSPAQETYVLVFEEFDFVDIPLSTETISDSLDKELSESLSRLPGQIDAYELFQNAPAGMALLDDKGRIEYTNQSFNALLNYSPWELQDKPLSLYCHQDDLPAIREKLQKLHQGLIESFRMSSRNYRKDGSVVNTVLLMRMIVDKGGSKHYVLQLVDITSRKEYEKYLQDRNKELEAHNQELDRFVASASHDLRAPLRSMLGLIYIMQGEEGVDPFKVYLNMMLTTINKLDNFIKDIIEHSRNSRMDVEINPIDFKEIVEDVFESVHFLEGADKIEKIIDIPEDATIYSDKTRLKAIFNNLITNAVIYHRYNQEQPFIKVSMKYHGPYVILKVTDNGRGIDKAYQDKIFEMFFRATEDIKGSGLGLYIVKEAVKKLGGNIAIESTPNVGTTFTVKLPANLPSEI